VKGVNVTPGILPQPQRRPRRHLNDEGYYGWATRVALRSSGRTRKRASHSMGRTAKRNQAASRDLGVAVGA